ncbi:hypothetical protein AAMO2058_001129800 [Amorphochlora amoebiformis]
MSMSSYWRGGGNDACVCGGNQKYKGNPKLMLLLTLQDTKVSVAVSLHKDGPVGVSEGKTFFLEIMSEMKNTGDWPKAVWLGQIIIIPA